MRAGKIQPMTFIVWAPRTGEIYAEVLSEEEVAAVVSEVHETEPDTEIEVGVA